MVLFNYSTRELTAKIVYYGPGLCGKTTNLQYIHANLPDGIRGKMLSLATKTDRTLFFDFLPVDLGEIRGMRTRVQLYTVPGQVFYNETRKLVLKGADGIVFVADSQEQMLGANVESFRNLEENLKAHGLKLAEMPHIIQFNKRDLPKLTGIEEMNAALNRFNAPFYESVATSGIGVQDTLKAIFKLVLLHLTKKYDPKGTPASQHERSKTPVAASSPATPLTRVDVEPARGGTPSRSIPVAAFDPPSSSPAAIPLSAMDDTSQSRAGGGRERVQLRAEAPIGDEAEDAPSFGSEEIEDLVQDVEEAYPVAARAETTDWNAAATAAPSRSQGASSLAPPDVAPAPSPRGGKGKDKRSSKAKGASGGRGPAATPPAPSRGSEELFEVDRGFDPEWQPESSVRPEELLGGLDAGPDDIDAPSGDLPPVGRPQEPIVVPQPIERAVNASHAHPARPTEQTGSPLADTPVTLTEVAEDHDLFADPSLDVARLAAGDRREIVVPVEVVEGTGVRRFKLSIQLRFDPID